MTNDSVITATCIKDDPTNDCPLTILLSQPWKFLFLSLRIEYIKNIKMSVTFATKSKKLHSALLRMFWTLLRALQGGEAIGKVKKSPLIEGKGGGVR